APAMIGMLTHAPSRCLDGKIGSSPMNVIAPPVSSGESPRSCITERNCALMSKPADTFGVSNVLLVTMIPFNMLGSIRLCFFAAGVLELLGRKRVFWCCERGSSASASPDRPTWGGPRLKPGAKGLDVGCRVLFQLGFQGLRLGN